MTMKDFADLNHRLVAIGKQLEKNLNDWEVWAAKADILCSLGMHEVAIRCCDRSLELNPKNVLTWVTKGEALKKLGKNEEADAAFAKARSLTDIAKSAQWNNV
jgi:Flp pilus assembly protein TadD